MSWTVNNRGFFSLLSVQNKAVKPEICSADVVPTYPIFRPIEDENVEELGATYTVLLQVRNQQEISKKNF